MIGEKVKINVNRLNSDESVLTLVEIRHPDVTIPVRVVNDNVDFLSNGNNFVATTFEFKTVNDVEGQLPKCSLRLPNVGRPLVKWIIESYGAEGAEIDISFVIRTDPDNVLFTIPAVIENITMNLITIEVSLVVLKNNLVQEGVPYAFIKRLGEGLF